MITMRFSVLLRGHLVDEEDLPSDLAGLARSLDIVELEGGLRISNEQHELVAWQFEDLNFIVAWLVQGLESLFRGTPLDVCSPGQTLRFRSAGETIVVDDGPRIALPRREFLRELYDLCRRFTDFWTTVAGKWSEQRNALEALPLRHIEAFGGAVRKPTISPVAVDISVSKASGGGLEGTVDFLIGDALIRVGPLAGGLPAVLDGAGRLAEGVAKLRDGQVVVPVVLGHNTLWLTQQRVGISQRAGVCYRDVEAGLVVRADLDAECGRAVWRCLGNVRGDGSGARRCVAEVWPPTDAQVDGGLGHPQEGRSR